MKMKEFGPGGGGGGGRVSGASLRSAIAIRVRIFSLTKQQEMAEKHSLCFQLKEDFRSALFNVALMLVNDLKRPLDAVPHLNQLLKVNYC